MATTLENISVALQMSAKLLNEDAVGASPTVTLVKQFIPAYTNGTTANKADRFWYKEYTISSGADQDIDLSDFNAENVGAGAGNDHLGQALTLVEITAIGIFNESDSDGDLLIGGEGSTDAWNTPFNGSDTAIIGPFAPGSGIFLGIPDDPALAVAAGNKLLRLTASGGDVNASVVVVGRSA
jgi:hypothetical protein